MLSRAIVMEHVRRVVQDVTRSQDNHRDREPQASQLASWKIAAQSTNPMAPKPAIQRMRPIQEKIRARHERKGCQTSEYDAGHNPAMIGMSLSMLVAISNNEQKLSPPSARTATGPHIAIVGWLPTRPSNEPTNRPP